VQLAMRDAEIRLQALGEVGREPGLTLGQADARTLDDLVAQTESASANLRAATATFVDQRDPGTQGPNDRVTAAVGNIAASESAYAAALNGIAAIEGDASAAAVQLARTEEIYFAVLLIVLVVGAMSFVIIPAERRSASDIERSIRFQEQNARIGSEVAKHAAIRDYRMSEAQFQALFRTAGFGVALTDDRGCILDTNPALCRITGYDAQELRGTRFGAWAVERCDGVFAPDDDGMFDGAAHVSGRELEYVRKDKSKIWAEERITRAIGADGRTLVYIGLVNDVTARKQAEDRLRYDATHDTLTDLFNRKAFVEAVSEAIAASTLDRNESFAILMIDLDRFKFVNDSRGHPFGDAVLTKVSERLRACARPGDVVARFGGDEFTMLLRHVGSAEQALALTASVLETLAGPLRVGELTIRTSASIGICIWSPEIGLAETILQAADAAAYRAKAHGRACVVVYDKDMAARDSVRTQIGLALRSALENRELRLDYQPIVDIVLNRCIGFEALLRWSHPELGNVPPDLFIPVAEESGLMVPIGSWVMREAVRQLAVWQRELSAPNLSMNINVSAQQLASPQFLADLQSMLGERAVQPDSLAFELTETAMLEGDRQTRDALDAIRLAGAHLVLDDFGMGYSSLAYLTKLPIDALKIDRMFISGAGEGVASPQIVRALIALAHSMNLEVIAEGLETAQQAAELTAMGCRVAQGFLMSTPLQVSAVGDFMRPYPERVRLAQ
jgi:diguanylate cyclase (GGDEF)-like protein/PAS domain S-box-containing protein